MPEVNSDSESDENKYCGNEKRDHFGPDGKAEYSSETVDVGLAEEAVELCPQSAIRLESEDGT